MPTYSYKCTKCDSSFEATQSMFDAPLSNCEKCGGQLKKVMGQVGVTFKGSGFYKTDNAKKNSAD